MPQTNWKYSKLKKRNNDELSYRLYSEWKTSNWYIYWDRDYAHIKDQQLLVVWYAKSDSCTYYDYVKLKQLLAEGTAQNGLTYANMLTPSDINEFKAICHEFVYDMDREFG